MDQAQTDSVAIAIVRLEGSSIQKLLAIPVEWLDDFANSCWRTHRISESWEVDRNNDAHLEVVLAAQYR